MRLHKPKKNVWSAAFILFVVAVVLVFVPLPLPAFFAGWAFWLMTSSAALLLLGTRLI